MGTQCSNIRLFIELLITNRKCVVIVPRPCPFPTDIYHNGHNGVSRRTQHVHINPIPRRDRCEYYAVTAVVYSAQPTYNL